jgi:hypothetical protein
MRYGLSGTAKLGYFNLVACTRGLRSRYSKCVWAQRFIIKIALEIIMSTNPNYRIYPSSWRPVVAVLLILGGMTLLIIGSWRLSDGLNGIVIDYSNPFVHFSETTAAQEIIDGIIELFFGTLCLIAFTVLFFTKRQFLFPPSQR